MQTLTLTTTTGAPIIAGGGWAAVLADVLAGRPDNTRRAYAGRLRRFAQWLTTWGDDDRGRRMMGAYSADLAAAGLAGSSAAMHLSTVRAFVRSAAELDLWGARDADRAAAFKAPVARGRRLGKWATTDQVRAMFANCGGDVRGRRDRAILALAFYCGLRRDEIGRLTLGHLQARDGAHIIADLARKHGRTQDYIKLPAACWSAVADWLDIRRPAAGDAGAPIFCAVTRGGGVTGRAISGAAVNDIISGRARAVGVDLQAHDARRTCAYLARRGGASLEAISHQLGHSRLDTTARYLGPVVDLQNTAADAVGAMLADVVI